MHRASMIVICLLLGACSQGLPEVRPSHTGFGAGGTVLQPLEDGKRDLAAGRNGLAIRRFGEALGREPRSLEALNGLAVAYAGLGRHDVAQTYFERALEIDPGDVATLNNYGRSLIEQGRFRDARPFLEQALRRAPEADVPTIAANILSIRDAAPPALLTAFGSRSERPATGSALVRVAADRYRLQTPAPAAGPTPLFQAEAWPLPRVVTRRLQMANLATPLADIEPRRLPGREAPARPDRNPPRPLFKPAAEPLPVAKPVLAAARHDAQPAGARDERHALVRAAMAAQTGGTSVADLIDAILSEPTPLPGPSATALGDWT